MSDDQPASKPPADTVAPTIELSIAHALTATPDDGSPVPWFEGSVDLWESESPAPPGARPTVTAGLGNARLRDEGEIARGGMGAIHRLYDPELRRRVAMKVLDPGTDASSSAALRFLDEARITGQLDHPNIVPVHDLLRDDAGLPRYTMKLVEGVTLTTLIAGQKSQRDLEHLLETLIKVCDAMSFAHSRGIVHRDLKPDNVMVGAHGQVYVMDWGCAHVVGADRSLVGGRVDEDGTVIGTVQYMAPEQAHGLVSQLDARTDVFSLGAILYKVLTGSPPYPGPLLTALRLAQACELVPPDKLSDSAIKPPPHLSRIALKAMARDPAERYQTAAQLADELREFLRGGNWFPLNIFPPGAVIVREGDPAEAAYIITAGSCEVRQADPKTPGRHVVVRTLRAGDVFGEAAIFADAPRSATVVAVDEVSAVVVERRALDVTLRGSWLGLFVKALAMRFLDLDAERRQAPGP